MTQKKKKIAAYNNVEASSYVDEFLLEIHKRLLEGQGDGLGPLLQGLEMREVAEVPAALHVGIDLIGPRVVVLLHLLDLRHHGGRETLPRSRLRSLP